MGRELTLLTPAEVNVMNALWESEDYKTAHEVNQKVYNSNDVSSYYTVLKILENLEDKGYVNRDREKKQHKFSAAVTRDEFFIKVIEHNARALFSAEKAHGITQMLTQHLTGTETAAAIKNEDMVSVAHVMPATMQWQNRVTIGLQDQIAPEKIIRK